jgi:hypothetical protein
VGAVKRASQNLESTYIVRLTALLQIHLAAQHASLTLPGITNSMFLLNTVVSRYGGVIPERARAKCELALRVRNGIAHGRPDPNLPNMTFQEALAALNWVAQFLNRIRSPCQLRREGGKGRPTDISAEAFRRPD